MSEKTLKAILRFFCDNFIKLLGDVQHTQNITLPASLFLFLVIIQLYPKFL